MTIQELNERIAQRHEKIQRELQEIKQKFNAIVDEFCEEVTDNGEPTPAPQLYEPTTEETAAALATLSQYLSPASIIMAENGQSIRGNHKAIEKEKLNHEKNCPPSTRSHSYTPTAKTKALNGQTQGRDRGLRQSQRI